MNRFKLLISIVSMCFVFSLYAAEYQGSNIDGESYSCTAYSYSTSKYYYLTCEFSGSDVYLYFNNGSHILISLSDDEIDDPSSISAYDYK